MTDPINNTDNIISNMKKIHTEIMKSSDAPDMAYATGKMLNEIFNTNEYDENRDYKLTKNKIEAL